MRFLILLCVCFLAAFAQDTENKPRTRGQRGKSADGSGVVRRIKVRGNDAFRLASVFTKDGKRLRLTQFGMKTNPVPRVGVRIFGKNQNETTSFDDLRDSFTGASATDLPESVVKKAKVRAKMAFFRVLEVNSTSVADIDAEDNVVQQVYLASRKANTKFTPIVATDGEGDEGKPIRIWTTETKPLADGKPALFGIEGIASKDFFKRNGTTHSPNAAKVTPWINPAGFPNPVNPNSKICVLARFFYRKKSNNIELGAKSEETTADPNEDDIAAVNEDGDGAAFLNWERTAQVTKDGVVTDVTVTASGFQVDEASVPIPADASTDAKAAYGDREKLTNEASRRFFWCYETETLAGVTKIEHDPSIEGDLQESDGATAIQASFATLFLFLITKLL